MRSIQITQCCSVSNPDPYPGERKADLCWRYICLIASATNNMKPSEVLDHLLWGGTVYTDRYEYRIEGATQ